MYEDDSVHNMNKNNEHSLRTAFPVSQINNINSIYKSKQCILFLMFTVMS